MAQCARWDVAQARKAPHERSISDDKVATGRGIEHDPAQAREHPNLKVPSLDVHQLKKIVWPDTKLPAIFSEGHTLACQSISSRPSSSPQLPDNANSAPTPLGTHQSNRRRHRYHAHLGMPGVVAWDGNGGSESDGKGKAWMAAGRMSLKRLRLLDSRRTPPAGASGPRINDINAPSASHPSYCRPKPLHACVASV